MKVPRIQGRDVVLPRPLAPEAPEDGAEHEGHHEEGEEEADHGVLRVSPVGQVLFPQARHALGHGALRVLRREVEILGASRSPADVPDHALVSPAKSSLNCHSVLVVDCFSLNQTIREQKFVLTRRDPSSCRLLRN